MSEVPYLRLEVGKVPRYLLVCLSSWPRGDYFGQPPASVLLNEIIHREGETRKESPEKIQNKKHHKTAFQKWNEFRKCLRYLEIHAMSRQIMTMPCNLRGSFFLTRKCGAGQMTTYFHCYRIPNRAYFPFYPIPPSRSRSQAAR